MRGAAAAALAAMVGALASGVWAPAARAGGARRAAHASRRGTRPAPVAPRARAALHGLTLIVLEARGRTTLRRVPVAGLMPSRPSAPGSRARAARPAGAARPAAARGRLTVPAALGRLERTGALGHAAVVGYLAAYRAALRSAGRLSGTRRTELDAVLANLEAIAAAGELTPSRAPALFLTLARNRQWWTTGPLLADGAHVSFPGSRLVWEYYAGQGIEIQWLATFGEANGYYLSGHDTELRGVLAEAIPLASERAGGIAWEYLFQFDGGSPPWTSGLSQGTAVQVLARAYGRFHEAGYLQAAEAALGIFHAPPPEGVRVPERAGVWYAQYTYAPHDRILNGFIQALVGLYDFTQITGDPLGQQLFEAGDAGARAMAPFYDTGAWSRYDQFSESSLSYHELLEEFLAHLCERTRLGEPLARWQAAGATGASGSRTTGGAGAAAARGGAQAHGAGARTAASPAVAQPIPGDAIYCTMASHFGRYVHTPPRLALLTRRLPVSARAGVQVALSKIATVSLTVRRGARVVWSNRATVEGGRPRLLWVTPSRPGVYAVSLSATDLAGNAASARGTIALLAPPRTRPGRGRRH
jgi:hypothetical protein